jgi:polyisoprenyl-teichoic acid--peptidoglycan teichoic acid transferase
MFEKNKKLIFFSSLLIFVIIVLSLILQPSPNKEVLNINAKKKTDFKLDKNIKILVLGADSVIPGQLKGWYGRSDFISLVYINHLTNEVSLLSIPRDTKIELKKHNTTKINSANQYGGYRLARRAVEKLLGIKIDYVVVLSMEAVIDLLEEIGPLKIFVPERMEYDDNKANLHIHIEPGLQELDGREAMNFIRFRNANRGDIARIERQHIFLRAIVKKLQEPDLIFKLPGLLLKANQTFLTDMSFKTMFELGILLRSLTSANFQNYIVPGDFGSNGYWIADHKELKQIIQKIENGEDSQK